VKIKFRYQHRMSIVKVTLGIGLRYEFAFKSVKML